MQIIISNHLHTKYETNSILILIRSDSLSQVKL